MSVQKITVKSVEKSANWGNEDARGNVRYFAVVRFARGGNKFGSNAIGTNSDFPLSYDLQGIYGSDNECLDKHDEFDPELAYRKFVKESKGDDILDGLSLYEIALPHAVHVVGSESQPFTMQRQAYYGTEKEAREYVLAALERDLVRGRLEIVDAEDAKGEE